MTVRYRMCDGGGSGNGSGNGRNNGRNEVRTAMFIGLFLLAPLMVISQIRSSGVTVDTVMAAFQLREDQYRSDDSGDTNNKSIASLSTPPSVLPFLPSCNASTTSKVEFPNYNGTHNPSEYLTMYLGGNQQPNIAADLHDYRKSSLLPNTTTKRNVSTVALAEYMYMGNAHHMAHGSQQLYRFVGWWLGENPTLPRVLFCHRNINNKYLNEMIETFQKVLNVTVYWTTWPSERYVKADTPIVQARMLQGTRSDSIVHFTMGSPDYAREFSRLVVQFHTKRDDDGLMVTTTSSPPPPSTKKQKRRLPVIRVLGRHKNRRLVNGGELTERLVTEFDRTAAIVSPDIAYFENATFGEQVTFMSQVDILVSSHGAQLVNIPFMPTCGGVLEVFQPSYHIPFYFGSLAAASGLMYGHLYTGSDNVSRLLDRKKKNMDICVPTDQLVEGVRHMVRQWHACQDEKNNDIVSTGGS
mmetsp:Transcript_28296/g.68840  ORF Transcript_28296/g.68840 Transcript_28296/m.68840 type:complete len:468 (-) Transcript_28296:226-1629(-)|eukprot:CAMPEP_0113461314 /NCGR_PEP_ID=MMETSP0014_2-20120614/11472_1 /TAXON_ID=2857 /ORGANISM="Nitzschia sp." /LENGTH=467 /DNA_ID=CAMNT_0000353061 /DNA_START=19 /DNA_END=1422 /DNA_ORIENTATION=+ /assembly_acc=CAM_ASM_000159